MMTLGEKLKALRLERRYTQDELAQKARISQGLIARIERGQVKDPSSGVLRRLARVLGCSMDYLAGLYEDDPDDALTALAVGR
jgi:transcriptional regulator with XRE-family HTH domain